MPASRARPLPPQPTLRTAPTTGIVGYRLRRAQVAVFQRFLIRFAQLGLRPAEYSVLALVEDNPGCKPSEIAEVLGIKRANFVSLLNGLEDRGWVERRTARGDRRAHALNLTARGHTFLAKARVTHDAFEADCVERLGGPKERDRLFDMLDKLID